MEKKVFYPTKVTSLKKFENGTATASALLLYSQDTPVVDTAHNKVMVDDTFVKGIGERFNKEHKGFLGFHKRYPKLVVEHIYKPEETVGRIDSPIEIRQMNIEGRVRTVLLCEVLLTEPDIIDRISNEELSGVSAGIYFDSNQQPYLKELTITTDPALKKAVLLSDKNSTYQFSVSTLVAKVMKMEDSVTELERMSRVRQEKINDKVLLAKKIQDTKDIESLKSKNTHKVLLSQVLKNKLLRKDADYLVDTCKDIPSETLEAIFSKVAPLKLHRGSNFKPQVKDSKL